MTNATSEPIEVPDEVDDWNEEWLAAPRRRSRWRLGLLLALAASLVFLGGVEVQKRFGSAAGSTAAAGGPTQGGFPSGGFPSGMPSGGPSGAAGGTAPSGDGASSGAGGTTAATQVIGTVVSKRGQVWVVKDLGGTRHRITVTDDTRIVRESELSAGDVTPGTTVDITLATDSGGGSGGDTASAVTAR